MLKTSEALQTLPMSFMSESLVGGVPDFKMLTYATTSTSESFGTNLSKFDERNRFKRLRDVSLPPGRTLNTPAALMFE